MTFNDKVGHVGYALVFAGHVLLALQQWLGWPISMLGILIWIWLGVRMRFTSIWIWEIIFLITAVGGWWNWTH